MINALLEKVTDFLSTNSPIIDYAKTTFGKAHSVFQGINPEDAPESTFYPLIAILGIERIPKGVQHDKESFKVFISVVIEKESISGDTTELGSGVKVIRFQGFKLVEEFREIIENELLKNNWGEAWKISVEGMSSPESFYPFFESTITLVFTRSTYRRLGHGVRED
jgi:hypothetical protein